MDRTLTVYMSVVLVSVQFTCLTYCVHETFLHLSRHLILLVLFYFGNCEPIRSLENPSNSSAGTEKSCEPSNIPSECIHLNTGSLQSDIWIQQEWISHWRTRTNVQLNQLNRTIGSLTWRLLSNGGDILRLTVLHFRAAFHWETRIEMLFIP